MINTLVLLGGLMAAALGAAAPGPPGAMPSGHTPAPSGQFADPPSAAFFQFPAVRIWVEDNLDHFYPGDPVDVRFRTAEDAYVAVIHLDTDGNLDLLFPGSPSDHGMVRGQRSYGLPGGVRRFALGRQPGIGYLYVIASPQPLDLRFFGSRGGALSDPWVHGRVVRGDPFWALEQLTQLLVGDSRFSRFAVDVFSYHLGGRHRYPAYACYDRFSRLDPRVSYSFYPSCDRLQRLLVTYPYYYDTRRYRGDRAVYLRELSDLAPRHGYKEVPSRTLPPLRGQGAIERPAPRGQAPPPTTGRTETRPESAPATPTRQRPTLERRPRSREPERAQPPADPPRESTPRQENPPARENPPRREGSRLPPRRQPDPGQEISAASPGGRPDGFRSPGG